MEKLFIENGGKLIQDMIDSAVAAGESQVTITGNYLIEKTILIPSDFKLTLEDCHLKLADGTFCNMITNKNAYTEIGRTLEGTDRNIIIEGKGTAILDGGTYNDLSELTCLKNGLPHICVNNTLLFANVDNFVVRNLHFRNQRWWALNFLYCTNGHIHDIDFLADYTRYDENGNLVDGLGWETLGGQAVAHIKNADGIDIRTGCNNILIENITGFCEDDTVAITGLAGSMEREMFLVKDVPFEIHDITVRNINACSLCAIVRLLNDDKTKLYNILVEDVHDTVDSFPYLERCLCGVRVGDAGRFPKLEDTHDITVRNVTTTAHHVLWCGGGITNLTAENLEGFVRYDELERKTSLVTLEQNCELKNFKLIKTK